MSISICCFPEVVDIQMILYENLIKGTLTTKMLDEFQKYLDTDITVRGKYELGARMVYGTCINKEKSSVLMKQCVNTPHWFMLVTGRHAKHILIMSNQTLSGTSIRMKAFTRI